MHPRASQMPRENPTPSGSENRRIYGEECEESRTARGNGWEGDGRVPAPAVPQRRVRVRSLAQSWISACPNVR